MKVWILLIFSFNLNHTFSAEHEFRSETAYQKAQKMIYESASAAPKAAVTLKASCIEDVR